MVQWLQSSYRPTATQEPCQRHGVKRDTETERTGKKHDILLERLGESERDWRGDEGQRHCNLRARSNSLSSLGIEPARGAGKAILVSLELREETRERGMRTSFASVIRSLAPDSLRRLLGSAEVPVVN